MPTQWRSCSPSLNRADWCNWPIDNLILQRAGNKITFNVVEGTTVIKCMLHISAEEQKARLDRNERRGRVDARAAAERERHSRRKSHSSTPSSPT